MPKGLKEKQEIRELFEKFGGLFSFDDSFGHTPLLEHEIKLKPRANPKK